MDAQGTATLAHEERESITFCGTLTLSGMKVRYNTQVMGMLTCADSRLNTVHVNGKMEAHNSYFKGNVEVLGLIEAVKSVFNSHIKVRSKTIRLDGCRTKSITLLPNPDTPHQTVTLEGDTHVDGDIVFKNGGGYVVMAATSSLSGKIIGGARSTQEVR